MDWSGRDTSILTIVVLCHLFGASSAAEPSCDDWNNNGNLGVDLLLIQLSATFPWCTYFIISQISEG